MQYPTIPSRRLFKPSFFSALFGLLLLTVISVQAADYAPPRVSLVEGTVAYEPAGEVDWSELLINLPVLSGDRVYTQPDSRVELELGHGNFLRLGQQTDLTFDQVSDREIVLNLGLGDLILRINDADRYRVVTPFASIRIKKNGLYRITVDESGQTQVSVRKGNAEVENSALNRKVSSGQELIIEGPQSSLTRFRMAAYEDNLDLWSDRRDAAYVSSQSASYVSGNYYPGVYDLDRSGEWLVAAGYGRVWSPYVGAGWVPYRTGRWGHYPRLGWTWISYEPWGWLPYHYGSWVYYDPYRRWCWVPGGFNSWSPALVNFYFGNGYIGWSPRGHGGRGTVINNTVINNSVTVINSDDNWIRRGRPGLTVVGADDFLTNRADRVAVRAPSADLVQNLTPGLPVDLQTRNLRGRADSAVLVPGRVLTSDSRGAGSPPRGRSVTSGNLSENSSSPAAPDVSSGWQRRRGNSVVAPESSDAGVTTGSTNPSRSRVIVVPGKRTRAADGQNSDTTSSWRGRGRVSTSSSSDSDGDSRTVGAPPARTEDSADTGEVRSNRVLIPSRNSARPAVDSTPSSVGERTPQINLQPRSSRIPEVRENPARTPSSGVDRPSRVPTQINRPPSRNSTPRISRPPARNSTPTVSRPPVRNSVPRVSRPPVQSRPPAQRSTPPARSNNADRGKPPAESFE